MQILVSGCSFVTGDELVEQIPGYLKSGPDTKLYKEYNNIIQNIIKTDIELYKKIIQEGKKKAWPGELQKLNDKFKVTNIGKSGISNEEICWRVFKELEINPSKPDMVIIMLTNPARFGYASYTNKNPYNFQSHNHRSLGLYGSGIDDIIKQQEPFDSLWRTHNAIMGIKAFLESKNISMILVDSGMCINSIRHEKDYADVIYNLMDVKLNFGEMCKSLKTEIQTLLPGSHPTQQMHNLFAKEIYKWII